MTKKKTSTTKKQLRPRTPAPRHKHGEGGCVDLLRKLSAYIDDELPSDICLEVRRHLGACPNCEVFIASLQHTVTLCRHRPVPQLASVDRMNMRLAILNAANAR